MDLLDVYSEQSTEPFIVNAIVHDDVVMLKEQLKITNKDPNIFVSFKQNPDLPIKIIAKGSPLVSLSVLFGSIQCLSFLLLIGADIEKQDPSKCTPLFYAVASCRLDFVIFLINNGANPNQVDSFGCNLLHYCAKYNQLEIAQYLIENNIVDIDKGNSRDATPLMWACNFGSLPLVQYFLSKVKDANASTKGGWTALHYAIAHKEENIINYLLSLGIYNINSELNDGSTPLIMAIDNQLPNIVDKLLSLNCAVIPPSALQIAQSQCDDEESQQKATKMIFLKNPFLIAVQTKDIEIINKVLEYKQIFHTLFPSIIDASLNFICTGVKVTFPDPNKEQNPPKRRRKVTNTLITISTDILRCIFNIIRQNPDLYPSRPIEIHLYNAIFSSNQVEPIQLFFEYFEIDPNWKYSEDYERTFMHAAVCSGSVEIIKYLLSINASPNELDSQQISPFYLSLQEKKDDVTLFLLSEETVDVNCGSSFERNLELANKNGNRDIIDILIARETI